ncbi:MAG: hypothetical protein QF755_04060 [Candidatus Peribacteraceae bacterium]|jgi:hypothetical protein|nr:hypothetical protein [Candidatus Peribacteraceae bacterium]
MDRLRRQFIESDFQFERHEEDDMQRILAVIGIVRGFIRSVFSDKVHEDPVRAFLEFCDGCIEQRDMHNQDTYHKRLRRAEEVLNS